MGITHGEPHFDPSEMSFSALHLAVLEDGRHLTLLDDRGRCVSGTPDLWQTTTVEEIAADARIVVGPDEAHGNPPDRTPARNRSDDPAIPIAVGFVAALAGARPVERCALGR